VKALGADIVAISPQLGIYNQQMKKEKNLPFDFLSDKGNQVSQKYGIVYTMPEDLRAVYLRFGLDIPKHNGDDSWTLPMSARLIIDRQRMVRYAQINPDYTQRPEPEDTVEALKAIV